MQIDIYVCGSERDRDIEILRGRERLRGKVRERLRRTDMEMVRDREEDSETDVETVQLCVWQ